jgi:hypothetical protein
MWKKKEQPYDLTKIPGLKPRLPFLRRAVIIQTALGDDGKPGRVTHEGVASLHRIDTWIEGRDAAGRPVFQIPTDGVAMAYLESDHA